MRVVPLEAALSATPAWFSPFVSCIALPAVPRVPPAAKVNTLSALLALCAVLAGVGGFAIDAAQRCVDIEQSMQHPFKDLLPQ